MLPISEEAQNFVSACEAIHALLARGELRSDDRDIIEFSAIDLLSKVRPT